MKRIKNLNKFPAAAVAMVCIVFLYPYQKIGRKVYHPNDYKWETMYKISIPLQNAFHNKITMDKRVIAYTDYDQHFKVYTDALRDRGELINYKQPENLVQGDTVIASEEQVFKTIEQKYDAELLQDEKGARIYFIKGLR